MPRDADYPGQQVECWPCSQKRLHVEKSSHHFRAGPTAATQNC